MIIHVLDTNNHIIPLSVEANGGLKVATYGHDIWTEDNRTQVLFDGYCQNTTSVLYTVPASNTLYITSILLNNSNAGAAANNAIIGIRDASDTKVVEWLLGAVVGGRTSFSAGFPIPVKVPAAYDVYITSAQATLYAIATVTGYLIPT